MNLSIQLIAGVEAILIISMCIYYFYDQLKETNTLLIYTTQNFWIIIAFLIYLSGTFFLYIYAENMIERQSLSKSIYNYKFIIYIFSKIFYFPLQCL